MEMTKVDRALLKALAALAAGMAVLQVFGQDSLTSVLFYLIFPLTVALWLRAVRKSVTGNDILVVLTAMLALICILVDCAMSRGQLSFDYLKKGIMFAMTLLFFQAASRMRADVGTMRFVHWCADLLTVAFTVMFLLRREQMYLLNGVASEYLTFGFNNPNLATLFLTMLYMLHICQMITDGKWRHGIWAAVLLYFVVQTGSRNALLTVAVFTVLVFCLRKKEKLQLGGVAAGLLAWIPIVFAAIYMILIRTDWFQSIFVFLSGEGKGLDSREEIWKRAWEAIVRSPLIGAYYAISDGAGVSQMHNSHLDIAASYGVAVLALVCVLLRRWLESGRNCYILGFAGALLLGLGEAAMFSGGLGIYIFAGIFLLLAKGAQDESCICQ